MWKRRSLGWESNMGLPPW
ncbi:hypothetical protein A2U01_0095895, partial [Trifolium medium]|nr:hypothetical protein [Trifolium medium]